MNIYFFCKIQSPQWGVDLSVSHIVNQPQLTTLKEISNNEVSGEWPWTYWSSNNLIKRNVSLQENSRCVYFSMFKTLNFKSYKNFKLSDLIFIQRNDNGLEICLAVFHNRNYKKTEKKTNTPPVYFSIHKIIVHSFPGYVSSYSTV